MKGGGRGGRRERHLSKGRHIEVSKNFGISFSVQKRYEKVQKIIPAYFCIGLRRYIAITIIYQLSIIAVSVEYGGAEIASTGKCKYGKLKYKVAKCARVENTSTENSSTSEQGWKMQVRKNRVWNNSAVTGNTTIITLRTTLNNRVCME